MMRLCPRNRLDTAHRLLAQAVDALRAVGGSGSDAELMSLLTVCEGAARRLDRVTVDAVAALERRGMFAERGYKRQPALGDLLGWERFEARRRVTAAEQVTRASGWTAAALPARLPATAAVFADGRASLRHVEVVARVLGSKAAERLAPGAVGGRRGAARREGRRVHPARAARLGHGAGRSAGPGR